MQQVARISTFMILLLCSVPAWAQEPRTIIEESQKRSTSSSQSYEGTLRVIDAKSKVSEKRWEFDRIGSHGSSKSVLRFVTPADVKGVALLIVNHPDRSSDQWMWTPAIGRERRIAQQDRSTRFFGTDFSFEDLEERDINQYDYKLLTEETIDGALCWKIESRPKQAKASQYTHSYVWVRKADYVVAQIENYKSKLLVRRARYTDIQRVQNLWTAQTIEMNDIPRNSKTILKIDKLQYNTPMKDEDFTIQAIKH
jgi:hypothetical protein